MAIADQRRLNCGADLHGPFCGACGQRAVPRDPTVSELAGDAWHELTGYDGRIAATVRGLLRPGRLTLEYLSGHRAKYLPPVRVYLIVSLVYFVVAAAAPPTPARRVGEFSGPIGLRIGLWSTANSALTAEHRAAFLADIDRVPWVIRPILCAVAEDPELFRTRLFTTMPRVFFGMLPVFAAIMAVFYRGRRFPTHLVFAVHVHAFAFVGFLLVEVVKFTRIDWLQAAVGLMVLLWVNAYALMALKAVYGGGWASTLVKTTGIGVVYLLASIPAFMIILEWAALAA